VLLIFRRYYFAMAMFLLVESLPAFAASPPQPEALAVLHRSGQSFITWTERDDLNGEEYRIYRHYQPITASSLPQATFLYQVAEGSGRFFADRYNVDGSGTWEARYLDYFVIQDGVGELQAGTGLLAWTLSPADLDGASSGIGFYAVTTVDSSGVENQSDFDENNSIGPVAEQVNDPVPVKILGEISSINHYYIQYMDLRHWNPSYHAPHAANDYYGLSPTDPAVANSIQYAYTYIVSEPDPANCPTFMPNRVPVLLNLHGHWGDNRYGPDWREPGTPDFQQYCIIEIRPFDISETWWFGFAQNHDYRQSSTISDGDTIVNYTEHRVLRIIYDLMRDPALGPRVDPNRIYVLGHSMGGSGALAFALRYPNIFAASYANVPVTNPRTMGDGGGLDLRDEIAIRWGSLERNLPVLSTGPGNWADHLQTFNGTGIWDWQDHQTNAQNRIGDEIIPLGVDHSLNDNLAEWPTQGEPTYGAFNEGRRAWGGAVADAGHIWLDYQGLPPTLGPDANNAPFAGFKVVLRESVPGLSNASGDLPIPPITTGGYNQTLEWSASWNDWDDAPIDETKGWQISLRTTDDSTQTVDVTPRRLQNFIITPGASYICENFRVSDNVRVAAGKVSAETNGLILIPAFQVTSRGNRLRLRPVPNVSLSLSPISTIIPSGGSLRYLALVANNTSENQVFFFGTNVNLPNGKKYPRLPDLLYGPTQVNLTPHETISKYITHAIPPDAPIGEYVYNGAIGEHRWIIWNTDHFTFEVTANLDSKGSQ
jgi:pimeloyl-ACP methyl ester carboxylesterase